MDINDLEWEDVLRIGSEKTKDLLLSEIGRQLEDYNYRLWALTSIQVPRCNNGNIENLIKLLAYHKNRR